jgi:hypothetical protein
MLPKSEPHVEEPHGVPQEPRLGRLLCACTFTEGARQLEAALVRLETQMERLEQGPRLQHVTQTQHALRAALDELRASHQTHVTQHNQEYARSWHTMHKYHYRAPHPLQTSAQKHGDLKRLRESDAGTGRRASTKRAK